ncbi:putative iron-regulated membrane protein [Luteimonas cucumeris]|uniref:Putative iron-regulated membrane protein n=1 Tax=Luteimonas cucumeris TaxID=985012 RepID=A0A562LAA2_9GAMM|nr:PepSY-associated TM helix domain-containing protein [Luteimonas cucumeris]TWI04599.1 putative iron-regulated membrane protein [Luteimonas cucumeris]
MQRATLKIWFLVHKWTSLVCTVFLLLLCLTGLPLIFWEEIGHLTGASPEVAPAPAGMPRANADELIERALAQYPGDVPLFFGWDDHSPSVYVNTGARPDTPPAEMHTVVMHEYTGEILPASQFNEGVMYFLYRLHTDVFVGLGGTLFLGAMALLFAAAIVSGVVLYAPFMRKLSFGTVRMGRNRRLAWLDLHNLLGIVTVAWALVVGLTGAINTLAAPMQQAWQSQQLAAFIEHYKDAPRPTELASLDAAIATARAAEPGMTPAYVSFPGTGYSGDHHYGVFMHGDTAITERLYRPVLIDAQTGALTAQPQLPSYMTALLLSQPLHFGDYGGLPLKFLWAILDLLTILVLISGLYLWWRRGSTEARITEIERGGLAPATAETP